jgi:hypothetical protein
MLLLSLDFGLGLWSLTMPGREEGSNFYISLATF